MVLIAKLDVTASFIFSEYQDTINFSKDISNENVVNAVHFKTQISDQVFKIPIGQWHKMSY